MARIGLLLSMAATVAAAPCVLARPQIISLGSGVPNSVTANQGGTTFVGGSGISATAAGQWALTGSTLTATNLANTNGGGLISADGAFAAVTILNNPQVSGNTASNVSPPFSMNPTLVPVPLAATESRAARWNAATNTLQDMGGLPIVPSLMVYGSGSSGSSTGTFIAPNAVSQNGRFIVGLGYISTYTNSSGTTIGNNTFQWRPWIWDAQANNGQGAYTVLPTPFRTSSNTWRRRTGNAYAVSNDGLVIVGAQEHNVASSPAADPDGGRPVVWRWDSGVNDYVMSFLPNGVNGSGLVYTYSTTPGTFFINAAGTTIVGKAADVNGNLFIAKWNWDSGSSTWSTPVNLGSNLAAPASWLPDAVTSCGLPPTLTATGMSDDGNTVVGTAVYSTCGSFMSGGFIWQPSLGIADWYDYLTEAGVPGLTDNYGPIGDLGNPNRGLPKLGYPTGVSTDGNAFVNFQGGTQRIPNAPSTLLLLSGGPGCISPTVTSNPAASTNFSACTSSVILNVAVSGTLPVSYQWYKDGNPLFDGPTGNGSTIVGSTAQQLRVNASLTPADAGVYAVVVTGSCGAPVTSTNAVVQVDPAFPAAANDTCATAQAVSGGTNVLSPAQSPCSAYVNDPFGGATCSPNSRADRWFVFTPATSGNYRLETCGSNFDTVITLFGDCSGIEIACNDDYTTGPSTGCSSTRSRIASAALNANQAYYIRIAASAAAFLSSTSTMNLSVIAAPTPAPNDVCTSAVPATLGANPLDTTEATNDWIANCNPAVSRDVWFAFTAPGYGTLRAATCPGTTWNTVLSIYDTCYGTELACNDNASITGCSTQSIIDNLPVNVGSTYIIRVGGSSATTFGAGTLTLSMICRADFNANGVVNSQDFFDFLTAFFEVQPSADINHDSLINSQDYFDFLTSFFGGC